MSTAAVILAAGNARHLGVATLGSARQQPPVIRVAVTALDAGLDPVFVVLGARAELVGTALARAGLPVKAVIDPHWRKGLASSLRRGIAAVLTQTRRDALVTLADQHLVTADHLRALCAVKATAPVRAVATEYGGIVGVPAVFDRAAFPELLRPRKDTGARALLVGLERVAVVPNELAAFGIESPGDEPGAAPT